MGILDEWIEDIPQQFQGKKRIEALISAFSKQMEELQQVFTQLDLETDLDSAVGKNLDMVGDIVTLTRKQAGVLAGIDVEDPVISDERYRQFLKYQMLVNTNECTYHDLMDGLALLWNVSPIYYREDEALPAVIILTMPFLTPGGKVVTLGEIPMVKPAGVRIEFEYFIKAIVEIAFNFWISSYDVPRCNTLVCGTYPHRATLGTIIEIQCEQDIYSLIAAFESSKTGTIRIGGKAYNATLGQKCESDIEIEVDNKLRIVNFLQAGRCVTGTKPSKSVQGIVIPKDILVERACRTQNYTVPDSGLQTSGGGIAAELLSVGITDNVETENTLLAGTPTWKAASPDKKTGKAYKTISVSTEETESDVNVYIAKATIRRCGTGSCGNKK